MGKYHAAGLRVGSVDDPAEAAADRTADIVVEQITTRRSEPAETSLGDASGWNSRATRALFAEPAMPSPLVSRRTVRAPQARPADPAALDSTPLAAARVQRAATATPTPGSASGPDGGALDAGTAQRIRRASGRGAPLEASVRPDLESAFGTSFDNVSVHADSPLPAEVGAIAFTHGSDIHFAPGQYRPDTSSGLHTLSHELAHVVQQGGASPTVHRLMSAPEFKESAKENLLQVHGKTMTEIDTQLEAYDALKKRGDHLKPGAGGIDKAINILRFLDADIRFWMESHEGDKGRQKQRAALVALRDQVWAEVDSMYEIRDAALQHGLAQGNVQFEDNKFIQKMEGSASSILDRLSPIIAAAVPSPGDGAKLEISVKIPVDPSSSSYVGFGLAIGLQRQDRTTTKISLKASVNGGGKVHGVADIGGELGTFIEAQGKDPKAALQLVSWGWYRRFRESVLPREVASFMWGGSTGVVGWKRSETWAANIEKENLQYDPKKPLSSGVGSDSTTNAYVRTGAAGSATASGAIAGIASMEGSVGLSGGTHYDKDTVEARKKKRGGKLGEAEKMPERGKTTYLGTRFMKAEASLGVSVGPFSGALAGALEWLWDQTPVDPKKPQGKKKGGRLEYLSGSLSAGCSVPLGGVVADQIANGVVKLAPSVVNLIKTLTTKLRDDDETGAPEAVGQVLAQAEQLSTAFQAFPQESFSFTDFSMDDTPMKSLGDQLQEGASVGESASSLSLSIAFGVNLWDRKAPISIDVTLNSEQGIQLDASIVSVVATRSRRVLRLKFNTKGEWSVD